MAFTRLTELFPKYYNKTATPAERAELLSLVKEASPQQLEDIIREQGQALGEMDFQLEPAKAEKILEAILTPQPAVEEMPGTGEVSRSFIPGRRWVPYAVAAAVIFLLGIGSYQLFLNKPAVQNPVAQQPTPVNDVEAPGQNRAKITLANGKVIYLDSMHNGTIAREGAVNVRKLADGQIVYDQTAAGAANAPMAYNTISNPVGSSVIDMTLTDGSRVWLNAASSLTYPVAFSGGERKVSITGEAYFEVAGNAAKPFRVTFNETTVEVLGTHFNINAYEDEPFSTTTLLEGAIKINKGDQQKVLTPGNQARINAQNITVITDADTAEAIAWKNNYFQFSSADIETVMRQTARWYNIEVNFRGAIPADRFSGKISRKVNLSEFLKVLKYSEVNCTLEGRKVTVTP